MRHRQHGQQTLRLQPRVQSYLEGGLRGAGSDAVAEHSVADGRQRAPEGDVRRGAHQLGVQRLRHLPRRPHVVPHPDEGRAPRHRAAGAAHRHAQAHVVAAKTRGHCLNHQ